MGDDLFLLATEGGISEYIPEHLLRAQSNVTRIGRCLRPDFPYLRIH
jgi:hypothetical protein